MRKTLVSWIGNTDLKAPLQQAEVGFGPLAQALSAREFDQAVLLTDFPKETVDPYLGWLKKQVEIKTIVLRNKLSSPMNFGEIYTAAVDACEKAVGNGAETPNLTFHLSPGTPAMAAVWIILAKTRFPAELIESSLRHGVQTASVPFDISADFIPDLLRSQDERLRKLSAASTPETPEFSDILHRSQIMDRLIQRARRVAARNVPVLIEGESGTGKELMARAIHRASPRRDCPFIAVNCGAIPENLIESELFGHEKGAFTGATQQRQGYFEAANKGTLFLDEIGDLPGYAQVKLLRVVQQGELIRVGSSRPIKVEVRIVAATNRNLLEEVSLGRFREDLFYRLCVVFLKLPALRDRPGDIGLLLDQFLAQINQESESEPGYIHKNLSASARNLMSRHPWPGNVRELQNTLRRAAIWSDGSTISADDIKEALLPTQVSSREEILDRPLGQGLNLPNLLEKVVRHYLERALRESGGNKTKAADMVGLPSYQTLTNWLARYGVEK